MGTVKALALPRSRHSPTLEVQKQIHRARGAHHVFLSPVVQGLLREKMDYVFNGKVTSRGRNKMQGTSLLLTSRIHRQQSRTWSRNSQSQKFNDLKWRAWAVSITGKNNLCNIRTIQIWQSSSKSHLLAMYYVWWQKEQTVKQYMIKQWKHGNSLTKVALVISRNGLLIVITFSCKSYGPVMAII